MQRLSGWKIEKIIFFEFEKVYFYKFILRCVAIKNYTRQASVLQESVVKILLSTLVPVCFVKVHFYKFTAIQITSKARDDIVELPKDQELFHDIKKNGDYCLTRRDAPDSLRTAMRDAVQREKERVYVTKKYQDTRPRLFEQELLDWIKKHDEIGGYPDEIRFNRTYRYEFTKGEYEKELRKEREAAEARQRAAEEQRRRAIEQAEKKAMAAIEAEERARLEAFDTMADDAERILHNSYYTNQERIMRGEMDVHDQLVETILRDDAAQKIRREMDEKRQEAIARIGRETQEVQVDGPSGDYGYDREKKCYFRYDMSPVRIPAFYGFDLLGVLKIAPELKPLIAAKKKQQKQQEESDNRSSREEAIENAVYSARLPWWWTLFFLLLSGIILFLLMRIALSEWLPLYLEDPGRAAWFTVPKVSLLFLHLQAHNALKIVIAAGLLMLLAAGCAARRRLIHYPLSIMMGILLASLAFLGMGTCAIMSIAVIVVLFNLTVNEYGRSEADERTGHGFFDFFLVIASFSVFAVKRNFFLEQLSRLNLLILIFLAVLVVLAMYTVIMIGAVAKPARQEGEKNWAKNSKESDKNLFEINERVRKLEQYVETLVKDEQQVLLEYKVLRLMNLWLRHICWDVLKYDQIHDRNIVQKEIEEYAELEEALRQAVK